MASVPKYPCIEMAARGRRTFQDESGGKVHDVEYSDHKFIKITGVGTLADVQQYREHKGWAVLGVHNFDLLFRGKREEERKDLLKMRRDLNLLLNPPEARHEQLRIPKEGAGKRGAGAA